MQDAEYMKIALEQAKIAVGFDEVPVGAIIVKDNKIIGYGANCKERNNCAVYHAEIVAITDACKAINNWYLDNCTMYVTLEPCPMCCGAILNSRIDRVVFGATDPKSGGVKSMYNLLNDDRLNHTCEVVGGVLEEECSQILTEFFKKKRAEKKQK